MAKDKKREFQIPDPKCKVLVVWDDAKIRPESRRSQLHDVIGNLINTLKNLLDAKQLSQSEIADKLKVSESQVSRWLNVDNTRANLLQIKELADLAERKLLIALIDNASISENKFFDPSGQLRQFYIGMGFTNLQEGPPAIARNIASVCGATSWSFYLEEPTLNIFQWHNGSDTITRPQLMYGLSWTTELPSLIIKNSQWKQKNIQKEQIKLNFNIHNLSPEERGIFTTIEWDKDKEDSTFAKRENVSFCIGIPFSSERTRAAVLFLNFGSNIRRSDVFDNTLLTAHNELHASIERAWRMPSPVGSMHRGDADLNNILDLLKTAIDIDEYDRNKERIFENKLEGICKSLWPSPRITCKVYRLEESQHCSECTEEKLEKLEFRDGTNPDFMVRRSVLTGETFFVDDLSEPGIRADYDLKNQIPPDQIQKIVVPLRCEAFYDPAKRQQIREDKGESKDHSIYECDSMDENTPNKTYGMCVQNWGAISLDTYEKVLTQAQLFEVSIIAHLVACAFYLRKIAMFNDLHSTVSDMILNMTQSLGKKEIGGPLDPLCEAIAKKKLIGPVDRCDIYPYDHVLHTFDREVGSFIEPGWKSEASKSLKKSENLKYLKPRLGGNSEKLLGVAEEYHLIRNAINHPRVSPITKIIGTKSLIGCSCRIGCSFKSDAVMWLGYRADLPENFLKERNYERLFQLRVISNIAAMFCVILRWWGKKQPDS